LASPFLLSVDGSLLLGFESLLRLIGGVKAIHSPPGP